MENQRLFEQIVKPGAVVYDIGANVGSYTLLASFLVGPTGRIVAIEPFPPNLEYLERHLALNRVSNVQIVAGAAYEADGEVRISEGASLSHVHLDVNGSFQAKSFKLDSLVFKNKYPIPTMIKMNVEGAEYSVLKGAKKLLEERRPLLLLSTHGPQVRDECLRLLASLGYTLQPLDGKTSADSSEFLAQVK